MLMAMAYFIVGVCALDVLCRVTFCSCIIIIIMSLVIFLHTAHVYAG
jgi:hypothetical protein